MKKRSKIQKEAKKFEGVLIECGVTDALILIGLPKEKGSNYYVTKLSNPKTKDTKLAKFIRKIYKIF